MKTHSQIYNEYSKIDSAWTLNFESIRRSNSQWNITLLDYKQKINRSGKCYARIVYQIEFYNFCLVLNEIWNKLLLTIPVIDKRANRRSNSQWNITLLDYKQKIYRSGKCYGRILHQIEFYNFCLVLNELNLKQTFTYDTRNRQARKHDIILHTDQAAWWLVLL
jgi:hypothetical protein